MHYVTRDPWEGKRVVPGRCPNVGSACNCIGRCQPVIVSKDDTRSDAEILAQRGNAVSWVSTRSTRT